MPQIDEITKHLGSLPEYMRESMREYIFSGRPVGNFLTALLSNDLRETFERADDTNSHMVRDYLVFLYNYAPIDCWGSAERVEAWIAKGGLNGTT